MKLMTSGGEIFTEVESIKDQKVTACVVDGDTSTEGSTSPDLVFISEVPTLNVNAPAFTSASSMTPMIITKNVEIGNERWKPNVTLVEENLSNIPLGELPQPFLGSDGLYYWPAEVVNNFPHPAIVMDTSVSQNGSATTVVNGHDAAQLFPHQLVGSELVNHHDAQADVVPKDLPKDELKRLIQLQFEYYFSRENLANDSYLVSQMDNDQYVFISTVAKFNQIRKLTSDMDLIVEALKESPYVQLDETTQKVRANMKRCIVILREIPEFTPIEEVKALFSHPNCPKWVSFEFAHNDSWYVTFDCEDDAKKAYRYLREEVQHFRGRPLMARIKAKTLLSRTVYLPKSKSSVSSVTNTTISTPTETTAQYAPSLQPISTFAVPPNAVFHPAQAFPFYAAGPAPMSGSSLLPGGTWMTPRQFMHQDIRPKINYNKHNGYVPRMMNGQRFYNGNKPARGQFRNYFYDNQNKVGSYERNDVDHEEHLAANKRGGGGGGGGNMHINTTNTYRKEDRFVRTNIVNSGNNPNSFKKDYRSNNTTMEKSPRFQRLRREQRSYKDETTKTFEGLNQDESSGDLTVDLALENFPALPSPNSPTENNKTASSLKELASNAFHLSQEKISSEDVSPVSISDFSETSTEELMSTSNVTCESLLLPSSVQLTSTTPKISYAQMAQKPNKTTLPKENSEVEHQIISEPPLCVEDVKKNSNINSSNNNSKTTDQKSGNTTPRSQRRSSEGSPRTQRTKTTQANTVGQQEASLDDVNTTPAKETYASKFGRTTQPKNTNNRTGSGKNSPGSPRNNVKKVDTTNLPPPRPLMSQIIKPPDSKLNELHASEQPQSSKTFSATVKKAALVDSSTIATDTASNDSETPKRTDGDSDSNKENICK